MAVPFDAQEEANNPKQMKVLLRNTQTGWYYQQPSKWTPEEKEAYDLERLPAAVKLALETRLENLEVLLSFEDPQFNLVLPVSSSRS